MELLEVLKPILIGLIQVIDRDGDLNGVLVEKINEILRQLGSWPKGSPYTSPPSLWVGLAQLVEASQKIGRIESDISTLKSAGLYQNRNPSTSSSSATSGFNQMLSDLENRMKIGFSNVDNCIANLKGVQLGRSYIPSVAELSDEYSKLFAEMITIQQSIRGLSLNLKLLQNGKKSGEKSVTLGRHSFTTL